MRKRKGRPWDGREKDALDIGTVSQQRQFERATKKFFLIGASFHIMDFFFGGGRGGNERGKEEGEGRL